MASEIETTSGLPVIALVGRPNVGKSTLFNRLTRSRDALVADFPGLTRDRQYGQGKYQDKPYILIDTGGLSGESEELDSRMAKQTLLAIEESDIVFFLVDAHQGLTPADEVIAGQLRKQNKQVMLVVNKADGVSQQFLNSEFTSLGFSSFQVISAEHNRGVKDLMDLAFQGRDDWHVPEESANGIKVALVGKPNVGKSTLINRLVGEERVVVMDMPGTTRDSIMVPFSHNNQEYTLIDTAGVRRRKKVTQAVEKFSIIKSMQAIEQANVVLLMIDARDGVTDQDLNLLGHVLDAGRALVIVINKWDGLDEDQKNRIRIDLETRLGFVKFSEIRFVSALHGTGVGQLYRAINQAYHAATSKFSTPYLTRLLEQAVEAHQPPLVRGRRIKLRYAHQGGQNPPVIVIHGNQTDLVPPAYRRYLMNLFIQELEITGTPLRLEFKTTSNPYAGKKNVITERQANRRKRFIRQIKQQQKKRKYKKT